MLNDMISNNVIIPKDIALWAYIQNRKYSLVSDLINYVADIAVPCEYLPKIMLAIKGLRLFKDLKEKIEDFTKKNNDDDILNEFVDKAGSNTIYEDDIVTAIIKRSVADFKRRTKRMWS